MITKLYNDAENNRLDEAAKPSASMMEIKMERAEYAQQLEIKQEKFDQMFSRSSAAPVVPSLPMDNSLQSFLSPSELLAPNVGSKYRIQESQDEPFNAYANSSDVSVPRTQVVNAYSFPETYPQHNQAEDISKNALHDILRNAPPLPPSNNLYHQTSLTDKRGHHCFNSDPRTLRISSDILNPPLRRPENIVHHMSRFSRGHQTDRSRHASNPSKIPDRVASWVTQQSSQAVQSEEESSPVFSPIQQSHLSSTKSIPTPSTPLPSVGDLFNDKSGSRGPGKRQRSMSRVSGRSDDEITLVGVDARNERPVSSANCARLQCLWQDPHVESCRRRQAQLKCSQGKCSVFGDLHAIWLNDPNKKLTFENQKCRKLNFYCNGTKLGESNYQWYTPDTLNEIRFIPSTVTDGSYPDRTCREDTRLAMRLLSRRRNVNLSDPRLQRKDYPSGTRTEEASKFRAPVKLNGWAREEIIFTWSARDLVKPSTASNHFLEDEDDDSDIQIL